MRLIEIAKRASLVCCVLLIAGEVASAPLFRTPRQMRFRQNGSFDETYERYPSTFAVAEQFKRIAPGVNQNSGLDSEAVACLLVNSNSAPVIGAIDPLQSSALEQEPGALFFQFYRNCVRKLVAWAFDGGRAVPVSSIILGAALSERLQQHAREICQKPFIDWPDHMATACPDDSFTQVERAWKQTKWPEIEAGLRRVLVARFLLYLVGPESVLKAKRYLGPNNVFQRELSRTEDLVSFLDQHLISLEQGQASVLAVYRELAILLRLGPAIRS